MISCLHILSSWSPPFVHKDFLYIFIFMLHIILIYATPQNPCILIIPSFSHYLPPSRNKLVSLLYHQLLFTLFLFCSLLFTSTPFLLSPPTSHLPNPFITYHRPNYRFNFHVSLYNYIYFACSITTAIVPLHSTFRYDPLDLILLLIHLILYNHITHPSFLNVNPISLHLTIHA